MEDSILGVKMYSYERETDEVRRGLKEVLTDVTRQLHNTATFYQSHSAAAAYRQPNFGTPKFSFPISGLGAQLHSKLQFRVNTLARNRSFELISIPKPEFGNEPQDSIFGVKMYSYGKETDEAKRGLKEVLNKNRQEVSRRG